MTPTHDPATQASADRPNCSFCRSDVEQRAAEMDRQRHREQLDAFDRDTLALIDRAEMQAAALMRVARGMP
jgi:predicted secreted Zn-dependent protease